MDEGGAPLVHQLGLALRIEILRDLADDPQEFALPRCQTGGGFFQEIQDIFRWQLQNCPPPFQRGRVQPDRCLAWNRAPEVVEYLLVVLAAFKLAFFLRAQVGRARPGIAVHGVAHERVSSVEQALDRGFAVFFFAFQDVIAGEFQVVEDAVGVGPLLEQIVVFEEVIVPERGVRDHQRLHGGAVFLHDIADAWVRVDDDLIRQPLHAGAVHRLIAGEMFAEGPVLVEQRHADGRIGIQHLFGANDLDLVGVNVQAHFPDRDFLDRVVTFLDGGEFPVCAFEQRAFGFDGRTHGVAASVPTLRENRSRNTG